MTEMGTSGICFVCGPDNAEGLRLSFSVDAEQMTMETRWTPAPRFQGYDGVVHGGLVATLLDEAVAKLCHELGHPAPTAELTIRYMKMVPTGAEVTVRGRIERMRGRVIEGVSEVILPDGAVAARASVKCIRVKSTQGAPQ